MSLKEALSNDFQQLPTSDRRQKAFAQFDQLGFPTVKNEEWKFTNINKLIKTTFQQKTPSSLTQEEVEKAYIPNLEGSKLVFINGVYHASFSSIDHNTIDIKSILDVAETDLIDDSDAFDALNKACYSGGAYVSVGRNKLIEHPIALYFINDAKETPVINHIYNQIEVAAGAQVQIVESHYSVGQERSLINISTDINVASNALVTYYKIQNDKTTASQINRTKINQAEKSIATTHTISLRGELIRNNLDFILNGEYIESNMDGLYLLKGNTHVDNHTVADHKYPNCVSRELYKGILADEARGVFNGKIFVRPNAQKTEAYQSNKNLLLSDDAVINTKPQLEIWADDVSCSHGCTIGQLDEEALFYLKSRGIGKIKATSLLLNAFAGEITDRVKLPALKEYLKTILKERISLD